MRIFLVGFMGCGKTALGREVSKICGMEFLDLDAIIEEQEGKSVSKIFKQDGEDSFRQIECQVLKKILLRDNLVIATGGGTPCFFSNMQLLKESGRVFYLKLDAEALFSRLVNSKQQRPLISGYTDIELKEYIEETMPEREGYYLEAHFVLNPSSRNHDEEKESKYLAEKLIKCLS